MLVRHAIRSPNRKKRRIALSAVALTAAFGIAMSRCVLGVHFPGDVLVGAILGATFGALGARLHLRWVALGGPPAAQG